MTSHVLCYFLTWFSFPPVSNNMFLISIQDLSRSTFSVHMSTNILFMMTICVYLLDDSSFFHSFLSERLPKLPLTSLFLPTVSSRQSSFFLACIPELSQPLLISLFQIFGYLLQHHPHPTTKISIFFTSADITK